MEVKETSIKSSLVQHTSVLTPLFLFLFLFLLYFFLFLLSNLPHNPHTILLSFLTCLLLKYRLKSGPKSSLPEQD